MRRFNCRRVVPPYHGTRANTSRLEDLRRTMKDADVSDILSSVGVPTLILCKPEQRAEAEYVAAGIPGSEVAELPGLSLKGVGERRLYAVRDQLERV